MKWRHAAVGVHLQFSEAVMLTMADELYTAPPKLPFTNECTLKPMTNPVGPTVGL